MYWFVLSSSSADEFRKEFTLCTSPTGDDAQKVLSYIDFRQAYWFNVAVELSSHQQTKQSYVVVVCYVVVFGVHDDLFNIKYLFHLTLLNFVMRSQPHSKIGSWFVAMAADTTQSTREKTKILYR